MAPRVDRHQRMDRGSLGMPRRLDQHVERQANHRLEPPCRDRMTGRESKVRLGRGFTQADIGFCETGRFQRACCGFRCQVDRDPRREPLDEPRLSEKALAEGASSDQTGLDRAGDRCVARVIVHDGVPRPDRSSACCIQHT